MLRDFLSLLFPRCCIITNEPLAKGEKYISSLCAQQLPKYDLTTFNDNLHQRFYGWVEIKHAFAYYKFSKSSKVQKLLHQLKYGRCPEVGALTAKWYANSLIEAGYKDSFDLIVPVPMHKIKKRKRGYNQCDSIAQGMASVLEISWSDMILRKEINNQSQTKKTRTARFENASLVYNISGKKEIQNKRILIVDDMVTTGATIGACAQLLLQNGCKEVSIAALATSE